MKPYPLASLNHFTRPFAMLPYLVPFFGAAPLDAPRLYAGGAFRGGRQTKTPRGLDLARRVFRSFRLHRHPSEPEPRKRLHEPRKRRQSPSTLRVTGWDPFRVPSQPGMAMENRPAVPPATTT